jgi:chromosome segregation ATPase
MAGKGPRHEAKEGYRLKEGHYSKDGSRRPNSPGPPRLSGFGRPSSSRLDIDGPVSSMGHPFGGPSPPMMIEQKLAIQHAEIQRLLGENQRLAVTHIALRQELTAAQQEIMHSHQSRAFGDTEKEQRFTITQVALRQELAEAKQEINRLQEAMGSVQIEKDQHIRMNLERMAKMEAELKAAEALKANFEQLRYERDELAARADHLTAEMKRLPMKEQEIATLKGEVDDLRQRHQQARYMLHAVEI